MNGSDFSERAGDRTHSNRLATGLALLLVAFLGPDAVASSKPWGELESESIFLEPPDDRLSDSRFRPDQLAWFLPENDRSAFLDQLNGFDLTGDQRALLQNPAAWKQSTNGWRFLPEKKLLLEMSASARGQIYAVLAKYPENIYQHTPFRLQSNQVNLSLPNSGLKAETLNTLKQLIYKRGECFCFSDMVVFGDLPAPEFRRVLKTLARVSAVNLRLRVSSGSDLEALVNYWGTESTKKNVQTLLESLARVPGGTSIGVINLLPPFARERLYCFPDHASTNAGSLQDCFWTSLNFFNEQPNDRFSDAKYVKEVLNRDYIRTQTPPAFGDLVTLVSTSGKIVHSSVYIADNIVFTKNGASMLQPWTLMTIPDMVTLYSDEGDLSVVVRQLKPGLARGRHPISQLRSSTNRRPMRWSNQRGRLMGSGGIKITAAR